MTDETTAARAAELTQKLYSIYMGVKETQPEPELSIPVDEWEKYYD